MDTERHEGPAAAETYADALRDRLRRVREELEHQTEIALKLRKCVSASRLEAERNVEELAQLRAKWLAEQPKREALLRHTGEIERRLAEREKRCHETLAASCAAGPSEAGLEPSTDGGDENDGNTHVTLEAQRQRLQTLETQRTRLTAALFELREAARQEQLEINHLGMRSDALKKEARALRAGAVAARESEARSVRKIEALHAASSAAEIRQSTLQRQVKDLKDEVAGLRTQLVSGTSAGQAPQEEGDNATIETNRRLDSKVTTLREELRKKEEAVNQLRIRLCGGESVSARMFWRVAPESATGEL